MFVPSLCRFCFGAQLMQGLIAHIGTRLGSLRFTKQCEDDCVLGPRQRWPIYIEMKFLIEN
jgi:hypothetical protein